MIHYFFGDDTVRARGRIDELIQKNAASVRWADAEDVAQEGSLESLFDGAGSSLFGNTVVVLRDPSSFPEAVRETLVSLVEKGRSSAEVVLWDRSVPDSRLSFPKKVKKSVQDAESFIQPNDEQGMLRWANNYQQELLGGEALALDGLREVIRRVGYDVSSLAMELQKLASYPGVKDIEHIASIVPQRDKETTAFPLLEAIVRHRTQEAIQLLEELIDGGASERFVLSMLAYQFRMFLAVCVGRDAGLSVEEIRAKTKLHPIAIQKALPMVSRTPLRSIHDALARIAAAEKSLTTKTMDGMSTVTMLTLALSRG